jgi:protein Tex
VIDETGGVVAHSVVYALPPQSRRAEAIVSLIRVVTAHSVDVVAVGNGTGGREMAEVVAEALRGEASTQQVQISMVSEAGAKPYKEASPDLDGQ